MATKTDACCSGLCRQQSLGMQSFECTASERMKKRRREEKKNNKKKIWLLFVKSFFSSGFELPSRGE